MLFVINLKSCITLVLILNSERQKAKQVLALAITLDYSPLLKLSIVTLQTQHQNFCLFKLLCKSHVQQLVLTPLLLQNKKSLYAYLYSFANKTVARFTIGRRQIRTALVQRLLIKFFSGLAIKDLLSSRVHGSSLSIAITLATTKSWRSGIKSTI